LVPGQEPALGDGAEHGCWRTHRMPQGLGEAAPAGGEPVLPGKNRGRIITPLCWALAGREIIMMDWIDVISARRVNVKPLRR